VISLWVFFQNHSAFNKDSGNTIALGDAGPKTRESFCCNPRDPDEVATDRQDFITGMSWEGLMAKDE
jgi:hypothetical protein